MAVISSPRISILVVDDDPLVCKAIARELRAEFDVIAARECSQALQRLAERPNVAGVLSDWDLGSQHDGAHLLREVQRLAPHLPRALMSGSVDNDMAAQLLADGVIHVFLGKPWPHGAIMSTARRWAELQGSPAESPRSTEAPRQIP